MFKDSALVALQMNFCPSRIIKWIIKFFCLINPESVLWTDVSSPAYQNLLLASTALPPLFRTDIWLVALLKLIAIWLGRHLPYSQPSLISIHLQRLHKSMHLNLWGGSWLTLLQCACHLTLWWWDEALWSVKAFHQIGSPEMYKRLLFLKSAFSPSLLLSRAVTTAPLGAASKNNSLQPR